jgi:hypothetical protein
VTTRRRRELRRALDGLDPAERASCAAALAKLHGTLAGADASHDRLPL